MNEGAEAWRIAHGETPDGSKPSRAQGPDDSRTGRQGHQRVDDKTLLIAGEGGFNTTPRPRRMLRAYNKATGAEVGAVCMPAPQERIADDLLGQRHATSRARRPRVR